MMISKILAAGAAALALAGPVASQAPAGACVQVRTLTVAAPVPDDDSSAWIRGGVAHLKIRDTEIRVSAVGRRSTAVYSRGAWRLVLYPVSGAGFTRQNPARVVVPALSEDDDNIRVAIFSGKAHAYVGQADVRFSPVLRGSHGDYSRGAWRLVLYTR